MYSARSEGVVMMDMQIRNVEKDGHIVMVIVFIAIL